MIALDLYCCAGGASRGMVDAGFKVVGIDKEPQPHYPYHFVQADVLDTPLYHLRQYDLIWASPPCQQFTAYRRRDRATVGADALNLIPQTRDMLVRSGVPYIIENVAGAPLLHPVMLCGSMFGLDVRRHRLFECSFPVVQPECNHAVQTPRFAPATNRTNLRSTVEVGVYRIPLAVQRKAMGIDWMPLDRLSQAIPPAYAQYLATQFLAQHKRAA